MPEVDEINDMSGNAGDMSGKGATKFIRIAVEIKEIEYVQGVANIRDLPLQALEPMQYAFLRHSEAMLPECFDRKNVGHSLIENDPIRSAEKQQENGETFQTIDNDERDALAKMFPSLAQKNNAPKNVEEIDLDFDDEFWVLLK